MPAASITSRIIHVEETVSTNIDALTLAQRGEAGPLWVVADRQSGGKGRSGRSWASIEGNLHASLFVALDVAPEVLPQISLVAGIGVVEAIRGSTSLTNPGLLRLKWPNDVLLAGGKVAGLLVESTKIAGMLGFAAVIGVGINLVAAPHIQDRATAALADFSTAVPDRNQLLFALDRHLLDAIELWDAGRNFAAIRESWMERAGPIGEALTVQSRTGPVTGTYAGLDEAGGLRLASANGTVSSHTWGDVTLTP